MQATSENWNLKKEFYRKAIHTLMLLAVAVYIFCLKHFNQKIALFTLFAILVFMLLLEHARLELKTKLPLFSKLREHYRATEQKQLGANIYFMSGVLISFAVFDFHIALAAVPMAIFGDITSALVGRYLGKAVLIKRRTLEGILAEFIVDVLTGILVLSITAWPTALAMAFIATATETLSTKISDNLTIPLFSGLTGQVPLWATVPA